MGLVPDFSIDIKMLAFGQRYNVNELLINFYLLSIFNINECSILSSVFSAKMEIIMIFLLNSFNMMNINGLSNNSLADSYNKSNLLMTYYFLKVLLNCLLMYC